MRSAVACDPLSERANDTSNRYRIRHTGPQDVGASCLVNAHDHILGTHSPATLTLMPSKLDLRNGDVSANFCGAVPGTSVCLVLPTNVEFAPRCVTAEMPGKPDWREAEYSASLRHDPRPYGSRGALERKLRARRQSCGRGGKTGPVVPYLRGETSESPLHSWTLAHKSQPMVKSSRHHKNL